MSPIPREAIKRILKQVKNAVKDFKNESNVAIADRVMNEANQEYYWAFKKSMLDYILKDDKEK